MGRQLSVAGDVIIDWIISNGRCNVYPGGVGNVVRGLETLGYSVTLTTVYNPMLYPLGHVFNLRNSLQDFEHRNVNVRNYDLGIFQRFREGLKPRIFTGAFDIVVLHEDTCVRDFTALYADVRDTTPSGRCKILRMSSTDPWKTIMSKIEHEYAIVTFDNKVRVFFARDGLEEQIDFPPAEVRDTVGAGDTFGVGFIDAYLKSGEVTSDAIMTGIKLAQEKVRQIGVFV